MDPKNLPKQKVQKEIYVNDCLSGESTSQERDETTNNLTLVLGRGGFKLKGFTFSGADPPAHLTEDGVSVMTFGMRYYSKDDELSINVGALNFAKKKRGKKPAEEIGVIPDDFTRRDCVGKVGEVFDLRGLVAPIVSGWKVDLSNLTKLKLDWDDKIPNEFKAIWLQNFQDMIDISKLRFKRAIVPTDAVNLDIQTIDFGDASNQLICAAIYARFRLKGGGYSCQLVFAKSKVVPEDTTMPRAELTAAVLNARIGFVVQKSFGKYFKDSIKLTDGQIVLNWVHNTRKRLKMFARNKVIEINRLAPREKWFYVNTKNMIADLGTRKGARIQDVMPGSTWIDGYKWMKLDQENFPIKSITEVKMSAEEKKQFDQECMDPEDKLGSTEPIFGYGTCLYALASSAFSVDIVPAKEVSERYQFCNYIIDPNRFRFRKVVRVLALVLSFLRRIKRRLAERRGISVIPKEPPKIKIPSAVMFQDDQYLVTQGSSCNTSSRYLSSLKCRKGMVVQLTSDDIRYALDYFF